MDVELLITELITPRDSNIDTIATTIISSIKAHVPLLVDNFTIFVQVPHLINAFITSSQDDIACRIAVATWNIEAQSLFSIRDST